MAGQRQLPQWYLDKVNLAANVFTGAPSGVDLTRPHVHTHNSGCGVAAQRKGGMGSTHPVDLAELPGVSG